MIRPSFTLGPMARQSSCFEKCCRASKRHEDDHTGMPNFNGLVNTSTLATPARRSPSPILRAAAETMAFGDGRCGVAVHAAAWTLTAVDDVIISRILLRRARHEQEHSHSRAKDASSFSAGRISMRDCFEVCSSKRKHSPGRIDANCRFSARRPRADFQLHHHHAVSALESRHRSSMPSAIAITHEQPAIFNRSRPIFHARDGFRAVLTPASSRSLMKCLHTISGRATRYAPVTAVIADARHELFQATKTSPL